MRDENAPVWAILDDYSYTPVEVTREASSRLYYRVWNSDRAKDAERFTLSAFPWRGGEAEAIRLSRELSAARDEMNRRKQEAANWFRQQRAAILANKDTNHDR